MSASRFFSGLTGRSEKATHDLGAALNEVTSLTQCFCSSRRPAATHRRPRPVPEIRAVILALSESLKDGVKSYQRIVRH